MFNLASLVSVYYSVALSLELLILAATVSAGIPFPKNAFLETLLLRYRNSVVEERELLLYGIFGVACLLVHALIVFTQERRLEEASFQRAMIRLSIVQTFWLISHLTAVFNMVMHPDLSGFKILFYLSLSGSLLSKIFYPEASSLWDRLERYLSKINPPLKRQEQEPSSAYVKARGMVLALSLPAVSAVVLTGILSGRWHLGYLQHEVPFLLQHKHYYSLIVGVAVLIIQGLFVLDILWQGFWQQRKLSCSWIYMVFLSAGGVWIQHARSVPVAFYDSYAAVFFIFLLFVAVKLMRGMGVGRLQGALLVLAWGFQAYFFLVLIRQPNVILPVILSMASALYLSYRYPSSALGQSYLDRHRGLWFAEVSIVLLLFASVWQMHVFHSRPLMAQYAFTTLVMMSILIKLFWPYAVVLYEYCKNHCVRSALKGWGDILAVLFIFLAVFIPDPQAVVAWMYMGEQFHQWDGNFMGVCQGLLTGLLPDVDILSTYGFGLPVVMMGLMNLFGGFDYANALKGMFWVCIIYFSCWYFLLRKWYLSAALVFAAIMVAMRAQMFDQMMIPIIWTQVPASILRYCFDVLFFASLYGHIRYNRKAFLAGAAVVVSLAMFHMFSTGMLLAVSLAFYLGLHVVIGPLRLRLFSSWQDYLKVGGLCALIPFLFLFWTWLVVKGHVFTQSFWSNVTEYNAFFYNNVMTEPLVNGIKRRWFLFSAVGLLYPIFYMMSCLYVVTQIYLKRMESKYVFIAVLSMYGFFIHSYYVLVSIKYFAVGLPGIFLLFFWLDRVAAQWPLIWQRRVRWAACAGAFYILVTSHMFMAYPNLLNVSRNPIVDPLVAQRVGRDSYYFHQLYVDLPEGLKLPVNSLGERDEGLRYERDFKTHQELKAYYRKETDFTKDAALIAKYTKPNDRVALFSSFEVLLLQQANRRPFFYYYPLINSRPMRMRTFMVSLTYTYGQVAHTLGEIEKAKPEYVFMEKIFLTQQVPQWYAYGFEELLTMIRYILNHYQPVDEGEFLVALKRKG